MLSIGQTSSSRSIDIDVFVWIGEYHRMLDDDMGTLKRQDERVKDDWCSIGCQKNDFE